MTQIFNSFKKGVSAFNVFFECLLETNKDVSYIQFDTDGYCCWIQNRLKEKGFSYPILFLTAHADLDMAISVFREGADNLLKKPVNPQELIDAISEAIRKDSANQSQGNIEELNKRYLSLSTREASAGTCKRRADKFWNRRAAWIEWTHGRESSLSCLWKTWPQIEGDNRHSWKKFFLNSTSNYKDLDDLQEH